VNLSRRSSWFSSVTRRFATIPRSARIAAGANTSANTSNPARSASSTTPLPAAAPRPSSTRVAGHRLRRQTGWQNEDYSPLVYAFDCQNVAITGSTGFAVITPKSAIYREFNYLSLTSESNINRLTTVASGAAYPAVNPEVVAAQTIAIPDTDLVQQFHQTTASFFDRIERHRAQNQELTTLRDWLLPMLMNGSSPGRRMKAAIHDVVGPWTSWLRICGGHHQRRVERHQAGDSALGE
jgi:hypothetical protein